MVAPDQEADQRDPQDRIDHEVVAEDPPPRVAGDELRDHAEGGQDHDVDGRVAVEPEQVLEQDRVAAAQRVEDRDAEGALGEDQQQHHRQHRRRQHHDDAGRVDRPDEQRQAEPGQPRRALQMDGGDEIHRRGDGREAGDEDRRRRRQHVAVGEGRRQRGVEGPAGIDPAEQQRADRQRPGRDEDVPAEQVQPREGEVAARRSSAAAGNCRASSGIDGHQEEPHHDHAVEGEGAVIGIGREQVGLRGEQLDPQHHRRRRRR